MGRHRAGNEATNGSAIKDGSAARAVGGSEAKGTVAVVAAAPDADAVPLPAGSGQGLRPRRNSTGRLKRGSRRRPAASYDLLGWGLFLTVTAAAAMLWAGIDWPIIAAAGFLLLLSFTAVWYVSSAPAPVTPPVPATDLRAVPSEEPAPVPAPADAAAGPALPPEASPAPSPASSPASSPVSSPAPSPALSPALSPVTPMTRKQMRAADPTTGLLPVVSVFARKPGPASVTLPARSASFPAAEPAAEAPVPQAPAGQLLQGIDAGTTAPDSRRARRAAGKGTGTGAKSSADKEPGTGAESVSGAEAISGPKSSAGKAVAKAKAALPAAAAAAAAADPQGAGDGDAAPESRWTRTFGPPETGQLPIQQYVAAAAALDNASGDRQQRSHSSL